MSETRTNPMKRFLLWLSGAPAEPPQVTTPNNDTVNQTAAPPPAQTQAPVTEAAEPVAAASNDSGAADSSQPVAPTEPATPAAPAVAAAAGDKDPRAANPVAPRQPTTVGAINQFLTVLRRRETAGRAALEFISILQGEREWLWCCTLMMRSARPAQARNVRDPPTHKCRNQ